jgi:class 3 adenylate cyclase/TolB-like protein
MSTTDEPTGERLLRAVLHADMVDYSKVTARNEAISLASVNAIRRAFDEAIRDQKDVWFRSRAGDAALGLFPTAVGAVKTAIQVQVKLAHVREISPALPVWLRIGVHLGEVIRDGDDWHGDSINTTARIQAEATPGGIMISGEAYRAIRGKIPLEYEDLGERELKGVGPVHLLRVIVGTEQVVHGAWWTKPLVYRRELGIAAVVAGVAVVGGRALFGPDGTGFFRSTTTTTVPKRVALREIDWPLAIGVMEIKQAGETPDWMCDITHQGLNALLTKFDKLRVFSKDLIDWKRKQTGKTLIEIANELDIRRMINGELLRSGVKVTLQVRVVDPETGQQIGTCEADGSEDKLVEIQNDVGLQLIKMLKVPVTKAQVDGVLQARPNVDLDVTKRFADAFGGMEDEEQQPPPKNGPGAWRLSWPPAAWAQEQDEAGVKQLLERYRAALEAKNLDQLAAIYLTLSDNTRDALNRYFQSANELKVQFSDVTVLFERDEALATFTRSDKFRDVQTGRDVNLEVRVSTVVAKADGAWKIKALRKPS